MARLGLNRYTLLKRVKERHFPGYPLTHIKAMGSAIWLEMNKAFIAHERIELKNFGVFTIVKRKKKGRDVVRNKPIVFKEKQYTVKFKLGKQIKRLLNA